MFRDRKKAPSRFAGLGSCLPAPGAGIHAGGRFATSP